MEKYFYFLVLFFGIVQSVQIPKQIHKLCDRDSVDFEECLKEAIQISLINMENGIPEFGMPDLDPYIEKKVFIEYHQNQISGKMNLTDVVVGGFSKSRVKAVRPVLQDDFMDLEIDLSNKIFNLQATIHAEGRINVLSLRAPRVRLNLTMYDAKLMWKVHGETVVKGDIKYMKIKKFLITPDFKNVDIQFKDLLEDNPELRTFITDFTRNNWRLLYRELMPVIQGILQRIGLKVVNKIFLKIPYYELFPSSFE